MSRKKKSVFVRLGGRHSGFDQPQWKKLENAYGQRFGIDLRDAIEIRVSNWLLRFENEDEQVRRDLLQQCKNLRKSAVQIGAIIDTLSREDHVLAREILPKYALSSDFKSGLEELKNAHGKAGELFSDESTDNKHAILIEWLVKDFKGNSFATTVARDNQTGHHNPSSFVNFIAELAEVEPRLQLRPRGNSVNSNENYSEWVYRKMP